MLNKFVIVECGNYKKKCRSMVSFFFFNIVTKSEKNYK